MPRRYREVALLELEVVRTKLAGARLSIEDVNDALKKPWSGRIACQVCLERPKPVPTLVGTGVGAFSDESRGENENFQNRHWY